MSLPFVCLLLKTKEDQKKLKINIPNPKTVARRMPGIIAATNESPIDCSVKIPYKINKRLYKIIETKI